MTFSSKVTDGDFLLETRRDAPLGIEEDQLGSANCASKYSCIACDGRDARAHKKETEICVL